jgi:hypothetical protein
MIGGCPPRSASAPASASRARSSFARRRISPRTRRPSLPLNVAILASAESVNKITSSNLIYTFPGAGSSSITPAERSSANVRAASYP